jgi:hypothetical protein
MVKHALALVLAVGLVLLLPAAAGAHCWDGPFSDQAELIHCGDDQQPIEDVELPPAQLGAHYAYLFETDQRSVSSYAVKEGELPDGLSLDDKGLLSGLPTATGHFSFVVITYNHVTGGTEQRAEMDVVAPPEPTPGPAEAPSVLAETVSTELPPPQAGKTFNIEPAGGVVSTRCDGDGDFRKLDKPKQVTLDCQIDAEDGTVSITASKGSSGETQTALFWGGLFDIDQEAGDNREAEMSLAGQRRCEKRGGDMGDGRRQLGRNGSAGRRLWGSGQGNYKTVGSHGSATVRGTIWLVADRCDGSTLFKVKRGTVVVRDFIKKSSVVLEAGQSYIAKVAIGRLP